MPQSLLTYKGGLLWLSVRGSPSLLPPPSYFVDLPGLLNGDFFFFFFANAAPGESLPGLHLVGVEVELSLELGL